MPCCIWVIVSGRNNPGQNSATQPIKPARGISRTIITSRHPLKSQKDAFGEAISAARWLALPLFGLEWGDEPYILKRLIIR